MLGILIGLVGKKAPTIRWPIALPIPRPTPSLIAVPMVDCGGWYWIGSVRGCTAGRDDFVGRLFVEVELRGIIYLCSINFLLEMIINFIKG